MGYQGKMQIVDIDIVEIPCIRVNVGNGFVVFTETSLNSAIKNLDKIISISIGISL